MFKQLSSKNFKNFETDELKNLIHRYSRESERLAKKEHEKYRNALTMALGHDRFEITNIVCSSPNVRGHVYTWDESDYVPHGLGKRKCCFCGCDDFDGY